MGKAEVDKYKQRIAEAETFRRIDSIRSNARHSNNITHEEMEEVEEYSRAKKINMGLWGKRK